MNIEKFLGRKPAGIISVVKRNSNNIPQVIKVNPFVRKAPFPTMYWLVCPDLSKKISTLEATGFIKDLENEVSNSKELTDSLFSIHEDYRKERERLYNDLNLDLSESMEKTISETGVGGVADFQRVRCLHMFYAYHLVKENFVGKKIDLYFKKNKRTHL